MKYITTIDEKPVTIGIDDRGVLTLDGEAVAYDFHPSSDPTLFSLLLNNRSYELRILPEEDGYAVQLEGSTFNVKVEDERTHRLAGVKGRLASGTGEIILKSPMPGVIIDLLVNVGDAVEQGQTLLILESMKMHNEFKAPRNATVKEVRVAIGDNLNQKQVMLVLE